MRWYARQSSAFTLLELLVATGLMAIAAACLYSSLYTGFKAKENADKILTPLLAAQTAINMFTQDVRGAVEPNTTPAGAFTGINDRDGSSRDTDRLVFYSSHHQIYQDSSRVMGGISLIELALIHVVDSDSYTLVRQVTDNTLSTQTTDPVQEILCRHVRSMNLRYFDGSQWKDAWNSDDRQDTLPLAVEITLEMEPLSPPSIPKTQRPSRYDKSYLNALCKLTQVFTLPCAVSEDVMEVVVKAIHPQPLEDS